VTELLLLYILFLGGASNIGLYRHSRPGKFGGARY